jgi:hypothetical protein
MMVKFKDVWPMPIEELSRLVNNGGERENILQERGNADEVETFMERLERENEDIMASVDNEVTGDGAQFRESVKRFLLRTTRER